MLRTQSAVLTWMLMIALGAARAAEPQTVLAEGAWSAAVTSAEGHSLRGRLVLVERMITVGGRADFPRQQRRGVIVFLELQNARDAVGPTLRVYCDPANALRCRLVDAQGNPIPPTPGPFGGGVPQAQWVSLPHEASIRLRSSPFGIHRDNAVVISPTPHGGWVIDDADAKEYFLSGTFTAQKQADEPEPAWHGTLQLPPVRIASPAAPDPILALVAKLSATHGLWLNGVSPILDAPPDATAEQVLAEVFEKTTPPQGQVTTFDLIEQRDVTIPMLSDRKLGVQEQYTAMRVRTNIGQKIVLLQRTRIGWWSRICDPT